MINCFDVIAYSLISATFMLVVVGITTFSVLAIQKLARSEQRQESTLPYVDDYELILNLEPDETEQQILELHAQGLPKTQIAIEVFGHKGGNQSKKIEDVITRWGS